MARTTRMAMVVLLLWVLARPVAAEVYEETWRSLYGIGRSVSVNQNDGSVWVAMGATVMHIAADGTVLRVFKGLWNPNSVSVDSATGTCWVVDSEHDQLVQLSPNGSELLRIGGYWWHTPGAVWSPRGSVVVDAADGSARILDSLWNQVVFAPANGLQQWRSYSLHTPVSIAVSPVDGSCWVVDVEPWPDPETPDYPDMVRLSATGQEVWRSESFQWPEFLVANSADGTCWMFEGPRDYEDYPNDQPKLVHLDLNGHTLWSGVEKDGVVAIGVNRGNGTVWIVDYQGDLVHLTDYGVELSRTEGFWGTIALDVNATDNSCWAVGTYGAVHVSSTGVEVWRGDPLFPTAIALNATDGTVWVADAPGSSYGYTDIVHLASDGSELWRGGTAENLVQAMGVDVSDDSCWYGGWGFPGSYWSDPHLVHVTVNGNTMFEAGGLPGLVSLAVDPTDNTVWMTGEGNWSAPSWVFHIARNGAILWKKLDMISPTSVSVNVADGSCWVSDRGYWSGGPSADQSVFRFARDGTQIFRSGLFGSPTSVSVNPTDGSCWVGFDYARTIRFSDTGEVLAWVEKNEWQAPRPTASPQDGSCWVMDTASGVILHLSEAGTERWWAEGFCQPARGVPDPDRGLVWVADEGNEQVATYRVLLSAGFRGTPLLSVSPVEVGFTDQSVGATTWSWDFGDGTTSQEQNPTHQFANIGTYQVSLTVTGDYGTDAEVRPHYVLVTFPDVPAGYWALRQVLACVDAGVVQGYEDGNYYPAVTVTRDQMATYIARALAGGDQLVPSGPAEATFSDVPNTGYGEDGTDPYWAYKYVEYCAAADIVQGYEDGSYQPGATVNRAQMAVYIARAHAGGDGNVPEDDGNAFFPDVLAVGQWWWCYKYVEYCAAHELVRGYVDGYHPEYEVTRDQMAVYIQRAFELSM